MKEDELRYAFALYGPEPPMSALLNQPPTKLTAAPSARPNVPCLQKEPLAAIGTLCSCSASIMWIKIVNAS